MKNRSSLKRIEPRTQEPPMIARAADHRMSTNRR